MFDVSGADSGREWIEVVNTGPDPVDLSTYKLFEGGINHKLAPSRGNKILAPNEVAILTETPSKFLADWPTGSFAVFDSAFTLSNDGETLMIRSKDQKDEDSVTYTPGGASGNGLSLSRGDSGTFVSTNPTPGKYVSTPVGVTITPKQKAVTRTSKSALQGKTSPASAKKSSVAQNQLAASVASVDIPYSDSGISQKSASTMWIWALCALALSLVGVGGVYAMRMHTPKLSSNIEKKHHALQLEADSYEIIE